MRIRNKGQGSAHRAGNGQMLKGSGGFCICPQCGYYTVHKAGSPCKTSICPDCNVSMNRSESPGKKSGLSLDHVPDAEPETTKPSILFPKVIAKKCTGCGICIDTCPTGTIVMENGKAFVHIENCRNCKVCIKACPVDAFKLE